jgi:pyruvate formate lyase activating enzyme
MDIQEIIAVVLKDKRYYEQSNGGLTISGGEPLAQYEFTLGLLRLAKENNLHTCIETSGHAPEERLLSLAPYVDLFLYDYKESDDPRHREFTGVSQSLILSNLKALAGAEIILRCPIIPTLNDRESHFRAIAETANSHPSITEINLMPYHPLGASKAKRLGKKYPLPDIGFPSEIQIEGWLEAVRLGTNVPVRKG